MTAGSVISPFVYFSWDLQPPTSHGFWTVCGHCTYFYASSQLIVGRICKLLSGTVWLCTEGLMLSFSVFSLTKTVPWAAASPCLHCFEGGVAQSVDRACCATQICFPLCSFAQTSVLLPHKNSISVKLCQILRLKKKKRFHFNWPIP